MNWILKNIFTSIHEDIQKYAEKVENFKRIEEYSKQFGLDESLRKHLGDERFEFINKKLKNGEKLSEFEEYERKAAYRLEFKNNFDFYDKEHEKEKTYSKSDDYKDYSSKEEFRELRESEKGFSKSKIPDSDGNF
ncbi:MAG: hypothetical protein ACRCTS_01115 [Fusobacteriaceae bacterium]